MSDLIDRRAALDCFHEWVDKHGNVVYQPDDMPEYMAIEALPSAGPKKGKWIREPYYEGLVTYRCSECMKAMGLCSNKSKWYNFCPNCGADMRGEEDETD